MQQTQVVQMQPQNVQYVDQFGNPVNPPAQVMMQPMQQPNGQVVMVPMGQQQQMATQAPQHTNGETNMQPQPQMVVVQQPATGAVAPETGDRYARWAYAIFGSGVCAYHFFFMWFWLIFSMASDEDGLLFFVCGFLPSIIAFVWLIMDSTVFCGNPGTGIPRKVCCCECVNGWIMFAPIVAAAVLRCVLWIAFFGILAEVVDSNEDVVYIDNVLWIILSIGAIDAGPLILLAIDWWWYYGKADYDALFGTKKNPLRCIVGQQILLMVAGWSFVAMFEEYADDAAEVIWPWIGHGVLAIVLLVLSAILQFSGGVTGNVLSSRCMRFVMMGLGVGLGVLCLIVSGYLLDWAFAWAGDISFWFTLMFLMYWGLYLGLSVPSIWACFSFTDAVKRAEVKFS